MAKRGKALASAVAQPASEQAASSSSSSSSSVPAAPSSSSASSSAVLLAHGIDGTLVETLMPFQREGVAFALGECGGRVLIADDMGLGKTIQSIAVALAYRKKHWPVLIVTPSSVKLNWADELERWAPSLGPGCINLVKSRTFAGNLDAPVSICSYGVFVKGSAAAQLLLEKKFQCVILDESHAIKSKTAIRTKMLVPIIAQARKAILLSGTPALAKPVELFPQVNALRPDLFVRDTALSAGLLAFCWPFAGLLQSCALT